MPRMRRGEDEETAVQRHLDSQERKADEMSDREYQMEKAAKGVVELRALVPREHASAVRTVLQDPSSYRHQVTFDEQGFAICHPIQERIHNMLLCPLHDYLRQMESRPVYKNGLYDAFPMEDGSWRFEFVRARV